MLQRLLDINNPFWKFMNKLFDVVVVNLLWTVFSLPVVTLGASTSAAFAACVKILGRDSLNFGVSRTFWRSFRENLRQGSLLGLIIFGLAALLAADVWYFYLIQGFITGAVEYIICVCLTVLLVVTLITGIFVFPLNALFENTVKATLKNALVLALRWPARSLGALAADLAYAAALVLSLYWLPLLSMVLLLFGAGMVIFINTAILMPVLKKYLPDENVEDGPPETFD